MRMLFTLALGATNMRTVVLILAAVLAWPALAPSTASAHIKPLIKKSLQKHGLADGDHAHKKRMKKAAKEGHEKHHLLHGHHGHGH